MALPPISLRKELADGVVALLNLQSWSIPCQAARDWKSIETIEDTELARLTVTPGEFRTVDRQDRGGTFERKAEIVVLVEQQTSAGDLSVAQSDEIDVLAQEVEDVLCVPGNRIAITEASGTRYATPLAASVETSGDRMSDGVFAVAVTVTYELIR